MTGQLGVVMRESAQAALTLVRSNAKKLGIEQVLFDKRDVHVHIPAGAIPKDGPSAGVAMYTALVSLYTDRHVRSDVAMTGEISLRGLVLPVGGIKSKVLGALAAGIDTIILPKRNRHDVDELPPEALKRLSFHFVERVEDALAVAFGAEDEECREGRTRRAKKKRSVRKKSATSTRKVAKKTAKKVAKRSFKKAAKKVGTRRS